MLIDLGHEKKAMVVAKQPEIRLHAGSRCGDAGRSRARSLEKILRGLDRGRRRAHREHRQEPALPQTPHSPGHPSSDGLSLWP